MANDRPRGFLSNARRKVTQLPTMTRPAAGGVTTLQLPDSGILAGIFLGISVVLAGAPGAANPLGVATAINNVRLKTNGGNDVFNASGVEYHYLIQQMLESSYFVAQGQNAGNSAVAAGTFNLDMYIPVQINLRDPVGLIMLQDQESIVTLDVDWAPAIVLDSGGVLTVTSGTCQVHMVYFDVPANPQDLPAFNTLHQILTDTRTLTGAIEHRVRIQTGGKYLQIAHGFGIGVTPADSFSRFRTMVNQSIQLEEWSTVGLTQLHRYLYGRARPLGGIYVDYMGTSGLGNFGSVRDLLDSWNITQYEHLVTSTAAGSVTLFTARRQLMPLI